MRRCHFDFRRHVTPYATPYTLKMPAAMLPSYAAMPHAASHDIADTSPFSPRRHDMFTFEMPLLDSVDEFAVAATP